MSAQEGTLQRLIVLIYTLITTNDVWLTIQLQSTKSTVDINSCIIFFLQENFQFQLRYLQSLHMIAGPQTHTVVFPYSVDLIKKLFSENK